MGDVQQPLFFGGLPPRGTATKEATRVAAEAAEAQVEIPDVVSKLEAARIAESTPKASKGRKRGTWALIVAAAAAVVVVPVVIVAMSMPSASTDQSRTGGPVGSEYVPTKEEAAAAEAAVAEGGGAVDGHIVSAELCTALDGFVAVSSGAVSSTDVSPEMLAAMEGLAAVESPNKAAYQGFVNLVKDPASVPSIADAQALSADFAKAAQMDTVTCM